LDSDFNADRLRVFEPANPCNLPFPFGVICVTDVENSNSGTGLIGGATISNAYSHNGQISFSYSRDTRTGTSSSTGSSSVDADTFELTLSHKLSSRVTLSAKGSYISYRTTDESLEANSDASTRWRPVEVRLEYLLRKNLTAYARYNYIDVNQDRTFAASDRAYQRRVYGVGVRYFFDREL
jgi:predicted porin